jgi:peptidoglycan/xylan/chitin deacetylase (PgdA/CDA1 family)
MKELLVLCYHGISKSWPAETTVAPADFESHMVALVERGYSGSTFSEALTAPRDGRTLVVTFDDAHASVLDNALPVMERLGLPGTVFVPTDYPSGGRLLAWEGYDEWLGTEHEDELRCMSWDDLRDLADKGWEIGSHSCSHPRLKRLDDERLAAELTESRLECERQIGTPCRALAYPRGTCDDRLARAARDCGYLFAATVGQGPTPPLPYQWPRIAMRNGQGVRDVWRRVTA